MRSLQVSLDALRTQHAVVKGEILPRLEPDDRVVLHLELDAALLAAEAAVRLHHAVGLDAGIELLARHGRGVRTVGLDDFEALAGNRCHYVVLALPLMSTLIAAASCSSRSLSRWLHKAP